MNLEAVGFLAWMMSWAQEGRPRVGTGTPMSLVRPMPWRDVRRMVGWWNEGGVEVSLLLPTDMSSTVLWAWVEGTEQVKRAMSFRPMPSMVLRMGTGSRRLLLWSLEEAVGFPRIAPANRRLAYALGATQKFIEPEALRVPLPGSVLLEGRKRPVPVLVTRMVVESFTAGQVVGRLREPPNPNAWRER